MSRIPRKKPEKPDWSPVEPGDLPEESPLDSPDRPAAVERWLEDGGRTTDADIKVPGEAGSLDAPAAAGSGKSALADALGHTEWRSAEAPPPNREAATFPGAGFLDALFLDFPFPAGKREVACHLAEDAALHAGPAATFHDLVIRLDVDGFQDIHELKRALGEQLAWASAHAPGERHDG